MRRTLVALGTLFVLACSPAPEDCRAPDAGPRFASRLGMLPTLEGTCEPCHLSGTDGDVACVEAYPDVGEGCTAVCREWGACMAHCPSECRSIPDGGCTPGGGQCTEGTVGARTFRCVPSCGETGGCAPCAFDAECVTELGEGGVCQRHCGTCCVPGGEPACNCI